MKSYLLVFTLAVISSLSLTPLVRRLATQWGAVDKPDNHRRIHKTPTPRLGGVAIYLTFLLTLACTPLLGTLVSQGVINRLSTVAAVLIAGSLIFALGVYDDFFGSSALVKVLVQLAAAAFLYFSGFSIQALSSPWGGSWYFPDWLSFPLTALWIVGITNAFNLIDGIDGLAAGASSFALLSLFLCSLAVGRPDVSLLSIVLVGATLGFLRYNFNPATIFLGDSGSLFLGFMAASLSLVGAQKGPTLIAIAIPLVSFGLPIAEVGLSLSRRFLSGAPLFQGDRRHIHHMLLQRGLTQRQAVIVLYGICALFSLFGLMLLNPTRNTAAVIFFVLGVGVVIGVYQLRYAEFNTLGSRLKHKVIYGRRSVAAQAQLLNSLADLNHSPDAGQLLRSLPTLCADYGLAGLQFSVHKTHEAFAVMAHLGEVVPGEYGVKGNEWSWQWRRREWLQTDHRSANQLWNLQAPLLDEQGEAFGTLQFYCDLNNEKALFDPIKVCGSIRDGLSAALGRLCQENSPREQTTFVREARPGFTEPAKRRKKNEVLAS